MSIYVTLSRTTLVLHSLHHPLGHHVIKYQVLQLQERLWEIHEGSQSHATKYNALRLVQ